MQLAEQLRVNLGSLLITRNPRIHLRVLTCSFHRDIQHLQTHNRHPIISISLPTDPIIWYNIHRTRIKWASTVYRQECHRVQDRRRFMVPVVRPRWCRQVLQVCPSSVIWDHRRVPWARHHRLPIIYLATSHHRLPARRYRICTLRRLPRRSITRAVRCHRPVPHQTRIPHQRRHQSVTILQISRLRLPTTAV